jgi:lysophospholipase L1-like esterase
MLYNPVNLFQFKLILGLALIYLFFGGACPVICQKSSYGLRMLALGDSYTIGESVSDADCYPVQIVKKLCINDHICFDNPEIIARTGWTTDNLLNAVSSENPTGPYRAVTLLIGVNNQFQERSQAEYKTQFTILLQRSIALAGSQPSHVLVLSIPDYSVTLFGRLVRDPVLIATQIDSFNNINRQLAAAYAVNWLDVTAESRKAATDPTLVAADGLHFSGKEYEIWAGLMEPVLKGMVR